MTTLRALIAGFRSTNKSLRIVVLLYAFNLAIAAILAWGFRSVLTSALGDSMSLERLVKDFDYTVYSDFMFKDGGKIYALLGQLTWLLVFYGLVNTLLGGGILVALRDGEEALSLRAFFGNCGYYFFRFFRLLLVFGIIGVFLGFIYTGVAGVVYSAVTSGAVSEVWPFTLAVILFVIFLLVVMVIAMMSDYAKIATVADDARGMLKTSWTGIKFVFRHFLSTSLLQIGVILLTVLGVALYLFLEGWIGLAAPITVLVMFLVQQLSVGWKVYTRVVTFGSELALFGILRPSMEIVATPAAAETAPAPAPVPPVAPVELPAVKPPTKRTVAKRTRASKPRVQKKRTNRKSR